MPLDQFTRKDHRYVLFRHRNVGSRSLTVTALSGLLAMFGSGRTKFLFRMGPRSGGATKLKLHFQIWTENVRNSLICLWMGNSSGRVPKPGFGGPTLPEVSFSNGAAPLGPH